MIIFFSDSVVSQSFSHPLLNELINYKNNLEKISRTLYLKRKNEMLKLENKAVLKYERLRILRSISTQPQTLYEIDSFKRIQQNILGEKIPVTIKKLHIKFFVALRNMEEEKKYPYNRKFERNILVVGQTECGKITSIKKITINNIFDTLKKIKWISTIKLVNL